MSRRIAERSPVAGHEGVEEIEPRDLMDRAQHLALEAEPPGRRQEVQPLDEDHLEEQPEPEDRHRDADDRADARAQVRSTALAVRREDAERDAHEDGERHRQEDQLERRGQAVAMAFSTGSFVASDLPQSPRRRSPM